MLINRKNLIFPIQIFFSTSILVWISLYLIKNPDLKPYIELLNSINAFGFSIEPTIFIFSTIAKFSALYLGLDPVFVFYFQYIYLLQFFLLLGFYNILDKSIVKSSLILVVWMLVYGTVHCLIQIRFGLANAIFIYLFSLLFVRVSSIKLYSIAIFGFFTHYSSVFAVCSLLLANFRKKIFNKNSYKLIHLSFILILLLFKFGSIFSFLPEFMLGRLSGYVGNNDVDQVSTFSIYISIFCYIILIISPKINNDRLNALKIYGALGFLPYFIVPELEIIVRLGIPFQYLLLPYLFLTFKLKKVAFFTTLPLLCFFSYKIFSNLNAFIGYL
ncbi:hypothetical protein [Acinetobacter bereziniae]|uniref:hypothetical protein n=1 Tax=Acinetobacter bereziniae TaxID=106648 RepID=UPI003AF6FDB8